MDYVILKENELLNANTYVPLASKIEFVTYAAQRCFERIEIFSDTRKDNEGAIPAMYKENPSIKSRYLMGALVNLYLKREYEPVADDKWLMSQDDYDRYAGGHVFNQIERMKQKSPELRNIAFDLLQDYHDLEKKLNAEIYGLMQPMNDTVSRAVAFFSEIVSDATQLAAMEQFKNQLQEIAAKVSEEGEKDVG